MEFTAEEIQKKYDSLPEDVKTAVSSVDTTDTLISIGEKYKLHVDKMGELVDETTLVMLGLKSTKGFVGNLIKRLNISQELAENIVKDLNEQILMKVRESLKKMHEEPKEKIIPFGEVKPKEENSGKKFSVSPDIIEPKVVEKEETEELKREDILKEIESPLEDIKREDYKQPENVDLEEKLTTSKEFSSVEDYSKEEELDEDGKKIDDLSLNVQKKPMIMSNLVENKLTQIVKEPIQEEKITEKKEGLSEVDPYREPIE